MEGERNLGDGGGGLVGGGKRWGWEKQGYILEGERVG